jgi:nucleotide-binding universal stress UspA family protein
VPLARQFGSSLVLLHVADGWAARTYGKDAVSKEITEDTAYLARVKQELAGHGIKAETELAYGEPKAEIVKWVEKEHCDLIAMTTHGHRFLADLFLGATAHHVQHRVDVPVLLVRAKK